MDWNERYAQGDTPWDKGGAHPELERLLDVGGLRPPRPGARVAVPGCGRGYDAFALARAGWIVTAIDVAPDLEAELVKSLEPLGGRVRIEDFLEMEVEQRFDLIFDHTFFCAIDPSRRRDWGRAVTRTVADGGEVINVVFPLGKSHAEGGPPWGMSIDDLHTVLGRRFELLEHRAIPRTYPGREDREMWARHRFLPDPGAPIPLGG